MKREYTNETVERALDLRQDEGQIRRWSYDARSRKYTVDVFDYGTFVGSLPATHGLVVGMRAMQVFCQRKDVARSG